MQTIKEILAKLANGFSLDEKEAIIAFNILMSGDATPSQIAGFLMALRVRGETVEELIGAVSTMRDKMTTVEAPQNAIDIVGTGGDGSGTYNISTCAAFVVAGGGLPVAKHGNRSISSKSGAGDVLSSLGLNLDCDSAKITHCIEKAGIGFMFAPNHHPAMRFVGPSRVEMGIRTIFNLIGPMSNPAKVKRQVIGVFDKKWLMPMAKTLKSLGSSHVLLVHGHGNLDEISISGPTDFIELKEGVITQWQAKPEDFNIKTAPLTAIKGGDGAHNAKALRAILQGEEGAHRDTVLLNAAAGFIAGGKASNLQEGIEFAKISISSGKALNALNILVEVSNS